VNIFIIICILKAIKWKHFSMILTMISSKIRMFYLTCSTVKLRALDI